MPEESAHQGSGESVEARSSTRLEATELDGPIGSSQPQNNDAREEGQTVMEDQTVDVYSRFSPMRKLGIVVTLCFCGFVTPISSTALLVAIPEIALAFGTTSVIINISNAMFFVFMAISPIFWGPLSNCFGRRWIFLICSVMLIFCSIGTAAAPNLAAFFAFRMLTAFQGTAYLVVGSVVIGDIYPPTERGRALSWFLSGILVGPTMAPLLGGVVITFTSWRVIFWILTGLSCLATVLVVFLLPETIHEMKPISTEGGVWNFVIELGIIVNPMMVIRPLVIYPNLWITALAVSALIWNQYSLLTPIRHVLNPRFDLTSPLEGALFYLAPGGGYLIGSFFGGRWSDYTVARNIEKRGRRVPEDRLKASILVMIVVVPACMILYGWSVEKRFGGIPFVVIVMFLQGFSQLFCIPSLNTYCIDVMQDKGQSSVVVAGNYLSRFLFAAAGTAVCLPAIQTIGVGWFSTISGLFISVTGFMIWLLTIHGEKWRQARGS
ncbi:major facilitator superfamily domain-containing protein [Ilyonectria robusta]|uniref:major facilitator superfamily domain-containing protein n=1 Tax=Ilyonectria robusta TaxID=1079257 RepID=UPI001E8D40C0|nr:major facilitator superfamily domain-containing protein [Ilyonectria robusta]KAH8683414.1 major facilitator superfamily domain-containing protein [Ilyonectria robusta]